MKLTPCVTCPWRRASDPSGAAIPGYDLALAKRLRSTVGPGDAIRPIMACHYAPEGREQPCRGYVARHGWGNIAVRLMAAVGEVDIRGVEAACAGLDLWPDFEAMLAAMEAAAGGAPLQVVASKVTSRMGLSDPKPQA